MERRENGQERENGRGRREYGTFRGSGILWGWVGEIGGIKLSEEVGRDKLRATGLIERYREGRPRAGSSCRAMRWCWMAAL